MRPKTLIKIPTVRPCPGFMVVWIVVFLLLSSLSLMALAIASPIPSASAQDPSRTSYHSYTTLKAGLQSLHTTYPEVTELYDIGTSWEGRDIWCLKISDHPSQNESSEPAVLIIGAIHGNERVSCEVVYAMVERILTNYGTNSTLQTIINTTELWFVPLLNPDGYEHITRKNARDNNQNGYWDNDDGVDLNRNFAYEWGTDASTSDNPSAYNYHGPAPFSEPESLAIHDLALDRGFALSLSYHSYGEQVLHPWGYSYLAQAPDHELFEALVHRYASYNGYRAGQSSDPSVGMYPARGDTDDWLYGNTSCLAFTVEVYNGSGGYNPPSHEIPIVVDQNYEAVLYMITAVQNPYEALYSGVEGTVMDGTGTPIGGATLRTMMDGQLRTAITDHEGDYVLKLLPGTYTLNISAPSHGSCEYDIVIQSMTMLEREFVLSDEITPEIITVTSEVGEDQDGQYEVGAVVRIGVAVSHHEPTLIGTINISSEPYVQGGLELTYDPGREDYFYYWDTAGLAAYEVYAIEASVWDPAGNGDFDGSNPYGRDLAIALVDTTAPVIETVSSAVANDTSGYYEIGSTITFTICASEHEVGLSGSLKISMINGTLEEDVATLYVLGDGAGYYRTNWSSIGHPPGSYGVECTLQDIWGNADTDGSNATGLDARFYLKDTMAPRIESFQAVVTTEPITTAEIGADIQLQVIPEDIEPDMTCYVEIYRSLAGGSEELILNRSLERELSSVLFNSSWETLGLLPGLYTLRATVSDIWGNQAIAVLNLTLVDTTVPILENATLEPRTVFVGEQVNISVVYRDNTGGYPTSVTAFMMNTTISMTTQDPVATVTSGLVYTGSMTPQTAGTFTITFAADDGGNRGWYNTTGLTLTIRATEDGDQDLDRESSASAEEQWLILIVVIIIFVVIGGIIGLVRWVAHRKRD